jgi:hypothetical protein
VRAGRDRRVGLGGEVVDAQHVVDELRLAVIRVQGPAAEPAALGDDQPVDARLGDLDLGSDGGA